MGYDWKSSGSVQIKEGVTLAQLVNAFYRCEQPDAPEEFDPASVLPANGYELRDDIDFCYDPASGTLEYSADSNSGGLASAWSTYLNLLAETYAAQGWEDYSGDDEEPTFYGPSPEAVRAAKIGHYVSVIEHALAALKAAA